MKAALLLIPFLLIRFVFLSILNREALKRAAFFAPMVNGDEIAYYIYQLSNLLIFIYLFFLKIRTSSVILFTGGIIIYTAGIILLIISIVDFAKPSESGINRNGIYRISRNPMYVAYFICFVGFALLTQSLILLGFVLIFQISAHRIILAEEKWCIEKFGEEYLQYMNSVGRYI